MRLAGTIAPGSGAGPSTGHPIFSANAGSSPARYFTAGLVEALSDGAAADARDALSAVAVESMAVESTGASDVSAATIGSSCAAGFVTAKNPNVATLATPSPEIGRASCRGNIEVI